MKAYAFRSSQSQKQIRKLRHPETISNLFFLGFQSVVNPVKSKYFLKNGLWIFYWNLRKLNKQFK